MNVRQSPLSGLIVGDSLHAFKCDLRKIMNFADTFNQPELTAATCLLASYLHVAFCVKFLRRLDGNLDGMWLIGWRKQLRWSQGANILVSQILGPTSQFTLAIHGQDVVEAAITLLNLSRYQYTDQELTSNIQHPHSHTPCTPKSAQFMVSWSR